MPVLLSQPRIAIAVIILIKHLASSCFSTMVRLCYCLLICLCVCRMSRKCLLRTTAICTVIFGLLIGVRLLHGRHDVSLLPCNWKCGTRVLDGGSDLGHYSFNVSVYLEYRWLFIHYYDSSYAKDLPHAVSNCVLPNGAKCILQNSDTSADVLLRLGANYGLIKILVDMFTRTRMCDKQLLAVLSSEAETSDFQRNPLNAADIRIDYHPSSDVFVSEICYLPLDVLEHRTPPDPSRRKGIAMFVSNCAAKWRTNYLQELMKHVHIDSYGACFHNARQGSTAGNKYEAVIETAKKYRMVVSFENIILPDYITEKLNLIYASGAIPVYWGPPQIYSWVPGNHSFIDASVFSPKELADYLKQVDQDDDLFKHHTTNLDIERSRAKVKQTCSGTDFICRMCQVAYEKKAELCRSLM